MPWYQLGSPYGIWSPNGACFVTTRDWEAADAVDADEEDSFAAGFGAAAFFAPPPAISPIRSFGEFLTDASSLSQRASPSSHMDVLLLAGVEDDEFDAVACRRRRRW